MGSGGWLSRFYLPNAVRVGLVVEPGCRLEATSWFLPVRIVPGCLPTEIGRVHITYTPFYSPCRMGPDLGPVWYAGSLGEGTGTVATDGTTMSTTSCPSVRRHTWTTHWRYTGVLEPGSVVTALP